jgi:hypothetical protein
MLVYINPNFNNNKHFVKIIKLNLDENLVLNFENNDNNDDNLLFKSGICAAVIFVEPSYERLSEKSRRWGGGEGRGRGLGGRGWDLVHQPRQLPPLNHHKSSPYIYSIYNIKKWNWQFFLPELHSSLGAKRWNVYKFNCITCTHICTLARWQRYWYTNNVLLCTQNTVYIP